MGKRNMVLAPFIRALRAAGWQLRYDTRSKINGRIAEYHHFFGRRDVQVQLWEDGMFRATHMLYSDAAKQRGRMSTSPTMFKTVPEMWLAVEKERTRKDHPPTRTVDRGANQP